MQRSLPLRPHPNIRRGVESRGVRSRIKLRVRSRMKPAGGQRAVRVSPGVEGLASSRPGLRLSQGVGARPTPTRIVGYQPNHAKGLQKEGWSLWGGTNNGAKAYTV
jgi:hypothetical protein